MAVRYCIHAQNNKYMTKFEISVLRAFINNPKKYDQQFHNPKAARAFICGLFCRRFSLEHELAHETWKAIREYKLTKPALLKGLHVQPSPTEAEVDISVHINDADIAEHFCYKTFMRNIQNAITYFDWYKQYPSLRKANTGWHIHVESRFVPDVVAYGVLHHYSKFKLNKLAAMISSFANYTGDYNNISFGEGKGYAISARNLHCSGKYTFEFRIFNGSYSFKTFIIDVVACQLVTSRLEHYMDLNDKTFYILSQELEQLKSLI